jgi:hypothetical protein
VKYLAAEPCGRCARRRDALRGDYGRLVHEAGLLALLEWNKARDRAQAQMPDRDRDTREMMDMLQTNHMLGVLGVGARAQPHTCGPSLRGLWDEAARQGLSSASAPGPRKTGEGSRAKPAPLRPRQTHSEKLHLEIRAQRCYTDSCQVGLFGIQFGGLRET